MPAVCIDCPTSRVARVAGDFWLILIIRALLEGTKRFSELHNELTGISTRTLSQKLDRAAIEGLIERVEFSELPPRVEYSLTKKGEEFKKVVKAMESLAPLYEAECKNICIA